MKPQIFEIIKLYFTSFVVKSATKSDWTEADRHTRNKIFIVESACSYK